MLNPSLSRRSLGSRAAIAIPAVAAVVTLCLASMHAPAEAKQALPAQSSVATVAAPTVKMPVSVAAPPVTRQPSKPPPPARPQGLADGTLSGTVVDSSGAVMPGVRLTVASIERTPFGIRESPLATTTANDAGNFAFTTLPEGRYSLKAELPGFTTFRKASLEIEPSQTVREDIIMFIGNIVERIQVRAAGQPKGPVPPGIPQRIRVGGNVIAANLISQVRPVYPQSAREAGIEGTVHLQGLISTEGSLIALRVVGGSDPDLANAALESVSQWRYRPTLLNTLPVEVLTEIDVDFKLSQ